VKQSLHSKDHLENTGLNSCFKILIVFSCFMDLLKIVIEKNKKKICLDKIY